MVGFCGLPYQRSSLGSNQGTRLRPQGTGDSAGTAQPRGKAHRLRDSVAGGWVGVGPALLDPSIKKSSVPSVHCVSVLAQGPKRTARNNRKEAASTD